MAIDEPIEMRIARAVEPHLDPYFTLNRDALDRIAATIAAHLPRWRPIDEAPKGEKLIVRYFNALGKARTQVACYYTDGTLESETDESGFAPEGWYEETEAYEYLMPLEHEPIYFLPLDALPEPPKD